MSFLKVQSPRSMVHGLFGILFCLVVMQAHSAEPTPTVLQGIGVEAKLGDSISLDNTFKDEAGQTVSLKSFFNGQKPIILALVYYECPNLCTYLLSGATDGFKKLDWNIGNQFDVMAVSIDPKETPELAAKKKASYLKEYGRSASEKGWHFLVGDEKNIKKLSGELGFGYRYVAEEKQYAHPAALFVLTPDGKLARVLGGVEFPPRDLRLALVEASQKKIGTVIDKLLLFCYRYDPKQNKYALFATNLMKVGGAATILVLGYLVLGLKRKGQK